MKRRFFAPEILSCLAAGGCLLLHWILCLWNHAPLLCRPSFAGGAMAAFLLLAGISCALSEWTGDAFTGQNGRLCGLLFLLAVGAMAYIASGARNAGRFAYFACSPVNINQPITTPLFFMLMTAENLARPRKPFFISA